MSQLKVTLERMKVDRLTSLGIVKEELPQYQIFGQLGDQPKAMVGYVGTQPNAPINIIAPDLPTALVEEITTSVKSQLATAGDSVAVRPSTAQMDELAPVVEDEEVEDEE